MKRAVFLDRDGVINDNRKPVNKKEDLIFFPWTFDALKILNDRGFSIFIVTNQGGIEMGHFKEKDLMDIHKEMLKVFKSKNISIQDIAYCPHFKTKCNCRKPLPGMILELGKKYEIDLHSSYMVGDRDVDMIAGKKAGCRTIKIGDPSKNANYHVNNLLEASKLITHLS